MYFEKLNKVFNGFFKHPVPLMVIRLTLVLVLIFMTYIPRKSLMVFENVFYQAFYLLLMAYVALLDAPSALLMAAVYLFAIQQLNRTAPSKVKLIASLDHATPTEVAKAIMQHESTLENQQYQLEDTMKSRKDMLNTQMEMVNAGMPNAMTFENNNLKTQELMINNTDKDNLYIQQSSMMDDRVNQLSSVFNKVENFEDSHPAFKTMTENIAKDSGMFTSQQQFQSAQSNELAGITQNQGIKAWANQISAQGLDLPHGFDPEEYRGTPI
jgi:hypothetical protein